MSYPAFAVANTLIERSKMTGKPAIYQEFKPFRANPITDYATDSQGYILKVTVAENPAFERTLNRVWDATVGKTPSQLVTISHAEGSAWSQTWNDEAGEGDPIPFEAIKNDSTYKKYLGL